MNLSLQLLEISHVVVLRRAEWAWYEVGRKSIHVLERSAFCDNGYVRRCHSLIIIIIVWIEMQSETKDWKSFGILIQ